MNIEKWNYKPVAGFAGPDEHEIEAVLVTKNNLEEVAQWCGGHGDLGGVSVPSRRIVGDPNYKEPIAPGSPIMTRFIKWEDIAVRAETGKYVVKRRSRDKDWFYAIEAQKLEYGYERAL